MAEGSIQLPPDSTGSKLRTITGVGPQTDTHHEVGVVANSQGAIDVDRRFEYQDVGGVDKPLYIGEAAPGALTSDASWVIQKYTFSTGPAGTSIPTLIQTRVGAWDNRAVLF